MAKYSDVERVQPLLSQQSLGPNGHGSQEIEKELAVDIEGNLTILNCITTHGKKNLQFNQKFTFGLTVPISRRYPGSKYGI